MTYQEAGRIVGCSHVAVAHHFKKHVAPELRKELEARDPADVIEVVDELVAAHKRTLALIARAYQDGDIKTCFTGQQTQLKQLEFFAKLTGMTDTTAAATLNLYLDPAYIQLQEIVVTSLAEFPEARLALGSALQKLRPRDDVTADLSREDVEQ